MKKGILIVLLLGICHVALAEDRRTNTAELVIMTFNVEFMWDGLQPEEGRVSFPWKGSPDEAAEHMAAIANVIIHSDPDIVNLVEVEGLPALQKLNNDFLQSRGYKAYLVKGKDSFTGQDVGLLTRVDPEGNQIARHDDKGTSGAISKGVSKNYYARFQIRTHKIGLIGIHFLSRPTDEGRRHLRQAQSKAIASLAVSMSQNGYLPIILGDMNDYDDNPLDHLSHAPITNVLHTLKSMDTPDTSDDLIKSA